MSELTDKEMHDLRALQTMADKGFAAWTNENFMDVLDTFDEVQRIRGAQSKHISKLGKQIADMEEEAELLRGIGRIERRWYEINLQTIQAAWCDFDAVVEALRAERDELQEKCDAAFTGLLGASRGECVAWGRKDRQPEIDKLREAGQAVVDASKRHDEHCAEMLMYTNDPAHWRQKAIQDKGKPRLPNVGEAIRMIEAALGEGDGE